MENTETRFKILHSHCRYPDVALVDIVIVNSRGSTNDWFKQAVQSCQWQTYGNYRVVVIENNDHALTVGAAWNLAAKESTAKYILFVGDDDYISTDLVSHLAGTFATMAAQPEMKHLAMVTSYCTMVDRNNRPLYMPTMQPNGVALLSQAQLHHTGMYLRDHIVESGFNEALSKHISTDMQNRILARGRVINARTVWASSYHYGYFYRQHIGMISGEKVVREQFQA